MTTHTKKLFTFFLVLTQIFICTPETFAAVLSPDQTGPSQPTVSATTPAPPATPADKIKALVDSNQDGVIKSEEVFNNLNQIPQKIINILNQGGAYDPKYDLNSDGIIAPIDALLAINFANANKESAPASFGMTAAERQKVKIYYAIDRNANRVLTAEELFSGEQIIEEGIQRNMTAGTYTSRFDLDEDGILSSKDAWILMTFYRNDVANAYNSSLPLTQVERQNLKILQMLDADHNYRLTAMEVTTIRSHITTLSGLIPNGAYNSVYDINGSNSLTPMDVLLLVSWANSLDASDPNLPLSTSQRQQLKIFMILDSIANGGNHDFYLSAEEVFLGLKKAAEAALAQITKGVYDKFYDINSDGVLSPVDALILINYNNDLYNAYELAVPMNNTERRKLKMLASLDTNNDRILTASETMEAMRIAKIEIQNAMAKGTYIQKYDYDNNGMMNPADLAEVMSYERALRSDALGPLLPMSVYEKKRLKTLLLMDITGDLMVTRAEAAYAISTLSRVLNYRPVPYYAAYDIDGDGILTPSDLLFMISVYWTL